MRTVAVFVIMLSLCGTVFAAGPVTCEDTIRLSVRSEFSRAHVYETDGESFKTLSYEYVEGFGWMGDDGSVYVRTNEGWEYNPPQLSRV